MTPQPLQDLPARSHTCQYFNRRRETHHSGSMERNTNHNRCNQYVFPRQPNKLSAKHWDLWRLALQEVFLKTYGNTNRAHMLAQPLGPWLQDPLQQCEWAFHPLTSTAFHRSPTGWLIYSPRGRSNSRTCLLYTSDAADD